MTTRSLVTGALLLMVLGCGGSGGGGVPPGGNPGPGTGPATGPVATAALTGQIDLFLPVEESILEQEPNGTQLQAHYLGEMKHGRTVSVLGHVLGGADDDSALDSFSLLCTERTRLDVTFSYDATQAPDIVLGLWDFTVQQYVAFYDPVPTPMSVVLHAKGLCALVVYSYAGEADYVLRIEAHSAGIVLEEEPNDYFYGGQFVGEVVVGDTVTIHGDGASGASPFDGIGLTCPEAMDLDIAVGIPLTGLPQNAEFDILVYDLTGGEDDPPLLDYFVWGATGQDLSRGTVPVAAGSYIEVFVYAYTGNARWSCAIRGLESTPEPAAVPIAPAARARPQLAGWRAPPAFEPGPEFVPGEALVRLAQGGSTPGGCSVVASIATRCQNLGFAMPPGLTAEEQRSFTLRTIACLKRQPGVEYAEPNFIRQPFADPDDTYYNLQWHYDLINLPQAWNITTGDPNVIVAVIDTGRTAHPDLVGREVPGYDFISDPAMALDGNGPDPDPTDPGDKSWPGFSSFHGTHVAGTIGASTNNGTGVAGVTWSGGIMPLRVLGFGGGTDADIANAILYAAGLPNGSGTVPAQAANVINMSLGGPGYNQTLADAVAAARNAGVVIFAASGNDNTTVPSYPAAYDGVISIGSVGMSATRAPYSNYGSTLDLVAPGGDLSRDDNADGYEDGVLSTWFYDGVFPAKPTYIFFEGTSMACPHAAGVAALMLAVNPGLTPAEIEQLLKSTAVDLGAAGVDAEYGYGLIDAYAAVSAAKAAGAPPPPMPPVLSLSAASLVFDRNEVSKRIRISNTGGGTLNVDEPAVILPDGESWLHATLVAGTSPASDASAVDVTVDRTDLADGVYFGRVSIGSNGGAQLIQVLMRVQAIAPPPPSIKIIVRAINADDGTVAKEVIVNPAALDLSFRLDGLVAGDYIVQAGTDVDEDGQFCEPDDLCGAYPSVNYPIVIPLKEGEEKGPVRFTVAPSGILPSGK